MRFNRARRASSEVSATVIGADLMLAALLPATRFLPVFTFAHRAWTALRALSLRCIGVSLAALASPPFFAPSRLRATAALFFRLAMILIIRARARKVEAQADQ